MTESTVDTVQGVTFIVALYEGLLPFPARWFGFEPTLSVPAHMDGPAWWIVAAAVLAVATAVMVVTDRAKPA